MIVVISQSATNQPQLRDYEEQLVAYLLLEAKCEVNLVPDLTILDTESTGLLCLEGIKGDMALLSWSAAEEAHALLESNGIQGRLGGTSPSSQPQSRKDLGPGVYSAMQRTVYHMQLDLKHSGQHYEEKIKGLARDSAVKTVSLGGPPAPSSPGGGDAPQEETPAAPASPISSDASTPLVTPVPKRSALYQDAEADAGELDDLIDRLDESDL